MEEEMDLRKSIADTGAVLEGEFFFALKNGRTVSTKYINIDPVLTRPGLVRSLCSKLVAPFQKDCTALAGPEIGGIPLLYMGADSLKIGNTNRSYRVAFAEKQQDGSFAFERMGFREAMKGQKVLVVEDVTTTGESAEAVCNLVEEAGGEVIGFSVIWNRGGVTAQSMGVPKMNALVTESVETWEAGGHPQWGTWPLVTDIGHPQNFLDYPGPKIKLLTA